MSILYSVTPCIYTRIHIPKGNNVYTCIIMCIVYNFNQTPTAGEQVGEIKAT